MATMSQAKSKRATSVTVETVDDVDMMGAEENVWAKSKKKSATLGNPQVTNADGLLADVDVQLVDDNPSTHEDKRQDVDYFFCPAVVKEVNEGQKSIVHANYAWPTRASSMKSQCCDATLK